MEYTKKNTTCFSLSCVAVDINKQRMVFVGITKKSESWDIYTDIRILQNVMEGTRSVIFVDRTTYERYFVIFFLVNDIL